MNAGSHTYRLLRGLGLRLICWRGSRFAGEWPPHPPAPAFRAGVKVQSANPAWPKVNSPDNTTDNTTRLRPFVQSDTAPAVSMNNPRFMGHRWIVLSLILATQAAAESATYYEVWRSATPHRIDATRIAAWLPYPTEGWLDKTAEYGVTNWYWVRAVTAERRYQQSNPTDPSYLELLCPIKAKIDQHWLTPIRYRFRLKGAHEGNTTCQIRGEIYEGGFLPWTTIERFPPVEEYHTVTVSSDLAAYEEEHDILVRDLARHADNFAAEIAAVVKYKMTRPYAWLYWNDLFRTSPDISVKAAYTMDPAPDWLLTQALNKPDGLLLVWDARPGMTTEFSATPLSGVKWPLPVIVQQPQHQSVTEGSNAMFTVYATNHAPLAYQWFKDGLALAGQTATNLVIANVTTSDVGGYSVVVTNTAGSVTSVVAVLSVTEWGAVNLQDGLMAHYTFDNNHALDSSGCGNHGSPAGSVSFAAGRFGNGAVFDGVSSFVAVTNPTAFAFGTGEFSVALWLKTSGAVPPEWQMMVFQAGGSGTPGQYWLRLNGDQPRFLTKGQVAEVYADGPNLRDGVWHHVVAERKADGLEFFVDGTLYASQQHSPEDLSDLEVFLIGAQSAFSSPWQPQYAFFNGMLDDFRVYNRALSAAEIAALAAVQSGVPQLAIEPTSLTNATTCFQDAADQPFTVRNTGTNTVAYAISASAPWLAVSPSSGSNSGEADLITVSYQTAGLPAGEYNGQIVVTAPGATNSPQVVSVHLTVTNSATLTDALDWPGQEWTASGPAPWAGQVFVSHDGEDSARSGPIDDDQQCMLETTVTGPGTLHWWWKVSSESDWDYLKFHFRGGAQFGISGERDWEERSFYVPPGTHAVQWSYSKDRSGRGGQDAAWVDQVSFEPSTGLTIVSAPQPQTSYAGSTALFSVLARGEQPISYQWQRVTGGSTNSLPGATESSVLLTNLTPTDAGYYSVTVSNVTGVTNVGASLAVQPLPPFEMNSMGQESFGGGFVYRFWVRTPPGADSVQIEVSSNLVTWTPIYTNPTPAEEFVFGERASSNQVQRFYRAVAR